MGKGLAWNKDFSAEVFFQIFLHIVLFLFVSFGKNQPQIQAYQIVFFINYAVGALLINYVLLPRFFYRKKYVPFFLFLILIIAGIILMEEFVLERISLPPSALETRDQACPK